MKRILGLILAVAAVGLLTMSAAKQKDIGDLLPVQTLTVERRGGQYTLNGGEGLGGRGETWAAAMEDLQAGAAGEAFFGCTGHVVLDKSALDALPDILRDTRLRPAARIYQSLGAVEPETATAFLNAHPGGKTLQKLTAEALAHREIDLPVVVCGDGGYRLGDG